MEEIGFLFCSTVQAREKVTVAIKVIIFALTLGTWYCLPSYHLYFCLQDSLNTLRSELFNLERTNEASVPLKVCGMFLDALFKHSEMILLMHLNKADNFTYYSKSDLPGP